MEIANTDTSSLEVRLLETCDLEFRAGQGDEPHQLIGYAAPFNSLSKDLGGFVEKILPGSFRESLTNGTDIRALVDHDPTRLLGRTGNQTLMLAEDEKGLRATILLPDTSYARDVRALVARRDIRGMSFGFKTRPGGSSFTKEGGRTVRTLSNIDLREVTVTSVPAYGATSLSVRVDPQAVSAAKALSKNPDWRFMKSALLHRTSLSKG